MPLQMELTGIQEVAVDSTSISAELGSPCTVRRLTPKGALRFGWTLERFISEPLLASQGELTTRDVIEACFLGNMQFWVVVAFGEVLAVATTELVDYPQFRALRIVTLAGEDFSLWGSELNRALARFAQSRGCAKLEAYGRVGLVRLLANLGFKQTYIGVARDLNGG